MSSRYDELGKVWDERAFKTAARATDKPWRWGVLAILVPLAVVAVVVLGGWQIGWWFQTQNADRNAHLIRHSFGFQQNLRDDITKNIGNVYAIAPQMAASTGQEKAALHAQAKAILAIVCEDAVQVTGDQLPPSQAGFIDQNCEAGNVSPSSSYN